MIETRLADESLPKEWSYGDTWKTKVFDKIHVVWITCHVMEQAVKNDSRLFDLIMKVAVEGV